MLLKWHTYMAGKLMLSVGGRPLCLHMDPFLGSMGVFMMWQLVSSQSDLREKDNVSARQKLFLFYDLASEITYLHLYHIFIC